MNANQLKESPEEFQHKICKKIAQLTRVIFQLNIQNDENDLYTRKLVATYQADLEKQTETFHNKLQEEILKLKKQQETAASKKKEVDNLKEVFNEEKSHLISVMNVLEQKIDSTHDYQKLEKALTEKDAKIQQCQLFIRATEENFKRVCAKFEADLKDKDQTHTIHSRSQQKQIDELLAKNSELENLVNATKGRISSQELIFQEERNKSSQTRKELLANLKKTEEALAESNRRVHDLIETIDDLKRKLAIREQTIEELNHTLGQLESSNDSLQSQITKHLETISTLETNLKSAGIDNNKLQSKLSQLEQDYEKSLTAGKAVDKENMELKLQIESLEKRIHSRDAEIKDLGDKIKQMKQSINSNAVQMQSELDNFIFKDRERQALIQSLKTENSGLKDTISRLQSELDAKKKALSEQIKAFRSSEQEIENLSKQLKTRELKILELNHEVSELQKSLAKIQEDLALATSKKTHYENEINALKNRLDAIDNKERRASTSLNMFQKNVEEMRSELQRTQEQLEKTAKDLSEALAQIQSLRDQLKKANDQVVIYKAKTNKIVEKIKFYLDPQTLVSNINATSELRVIEDLKKTSLVDSEFYRINAKKTRMEIIFMKAEEKISERFNKLKTKLKQLLELKKELASKIVSLCTSQSNVHALENENFFLKSRAKDLENAAASFSENIETLQQKLSHLKNLCQSQKDIIEMKDLEIKALKEEIQATITSKNREIDCLKSAYSSESHSLKDINQRLINEIEEKHHQALARLQTIIQANMKENEATVSRLKKDYEKLIGDLAEGHSNEMSNLHDKHNEFVQVMKKEITLGFEMEIATLKSSYDDHIKNMENDKAIAIKNYMTIILENKEQIHALKNQVVNLETKIQTLESGMRTLEAKLILKEKELVTQKAMFDETIKQERDLLKSQLTEQNNQLTLKFQAYKESLETEVTTMVEQIKLDFEEYKKEKDEQLISKEEQVAEMTRLFKIRPSKKEDLEQINALTQKVKKQQSDIAEMTQHLNFFKLELINREKNYNEIFNANPLIGVLDPISQQTVPTMTNTVKENLQIMNKISSKPTSLNSLQAINFKKSGKTSKLGSKVLN